MYVSSELKTWLMEARFELGLDNAGLAALLGVSLRTVERHSAAGGVRYEADVRKVIRALHPKNAALAKKLAEAAGMDLVALGLEPRPDGTFGMGPQAGPALSSEVMAIVDAVAEALGVGPEVALRGIAAAFTTARKLGFSLETLEETFRAPRGGW